MDPDPDFAPLQDDDSRFSDDRYFDEMWSRFDGCLDRRDRDICEQIFRHWKQLVVSQAERPKTLCHGDFHPNNIFLPHGGKGYPKVIDWQFCHVGIGVSDVADLMTLYVHPHLRKSCELEIIRTYWETLIQEGVENYSLEDCVTDYVIETCKNVLMPFFQLSISNLPLSAAVQCMRNVLLSFEDLIERRNNDLHEILGSIKISWPYVS
jgi:thiamine kinase-like enzyme